MAGRPPRAPIEIVPGNEVILMAARRESYNIASLLAELITPESCIAWLAARGLLRNSLLCDICGQAMRLNRYSRSIDGKKWNCAFCKSSKSVRSDSFFARSHLTLKQLIIIMYCWARDMPQREILHEADVRSPNTLVDWCNFIREECAVWLENHPDEIGGIDEQGLPIVVEIDESKYFHRKYHRGQWRDGHWVFGGIERGSGKCFLVEVPDRTAATLEPIIERFILPGSHIMSDGWAAYANIDNIGNGIYMHDVVVHQRNFVNPRNPDVHTENVENMWMRAKRKLRRQYGTSHDLFQSYLYEFMFRNRFRREDLFSNFLNAVNELYPV